jgi:hypothetical protein
MCCDDADSAWIALAAAARNVRAFLLLRKKTGPEANRDESPEPVPASRGAEAESE